MQSSALLAPPMPQHNIEAVYSQGANDFLRDTTVGLIRKLEHYLSTNIRRNERLNDAIPLVKRAVELYKNQDYKQSVLQCFQVYLHINALRASGAKDLPPL